MPRSETDWQKLAGEAAARVDRQRDMAGQLSLFDGGDDAAQGEGDDLGDDGAKVGRPKGSKNKGSSQLREYLAAKGHRMPEDVLAEVAGLRSRDDAVTLAMQQTERVLAWAWDGAHLGKKAAPKPTPQMRLQLFEAQYRAICAASAALLPYIAAKASPDVQINDNRTVIVPAAPAPRMVEGKGQPMRDVTPARRMIPADMVEEIEQNQDLNESRSDDADTIARTQGASCGKERENPDEPTD